MPSVPSHEPHYEKTLSMIRSLNDRHRTKSSTCKIQNHLFELNVAKPTVHKGQPLNVF